MKEKRKKNKIKTKNTLRGITKQGNNKRKESLKHYVKRYVERILTHRIKKIQWAEKILENEELCWKVSIKNPILCTLTN